MHDVVTASTMSSTTSPVMKEHYTTTKKLEPSIGLEQSLEDEQALEIGGRGSLMRRENVNERASLMGRKRGPRSKGIY